MIVNCMMHFLKSRTVSIQRKIHLHDATVEMSDLHKEQLLDNKEILY